MEEAKKKSPLSLIPLSGVALEQVYEFYKHVYEHRYKHTYEIALWANRVNRIPGHDAPMFLLRDGVIIGQMGFFRETYSIDNKNYTASCGFDFIVSQEYRGRGLGILLIKGTMNIADISLAFNNASSGPLGERLGTLPNAKTYYHYLRLNPLKGKKYLPRKSFTFIKNIFASAFYKYSSQAEKDSRKYILEIPTKESLKPFIRTSFDKENTVFMVRDWDYLKWRVLESPDLQYYRVFGIEGDENNKLLVTTKNPEKLAVLMSSDVLNYDAIIRNIASLAFWGIKEGFFTLLYFTANEELSKKLRQSFKIFKTNHPPFQFFSQIPELHEKIKKANWTFEMINNDFEFMI